jgi:hypothetical protein
MDLICFFRPPSISIYLRTGSAKENAGSIPLSPISIPGRLLQRAWPGEVNCAKVDSKFGISFSFFSPSLSPLRHLKHPETGVCFKTVRLPDNTRYTEKNVRTILTCRTIEQTFSHGRRTYSPADRHVSANSSPAVARFSIWKILRYTKFLDFYLFPLPDIKKEDERPFKLAETLPTGASFSCSRHVRVTLPCETSF